MISVVIPTYNRSGLLRRAIESALAQKDSARQIIVVDDGSTDDTRHVCSAYVGQIEYVWQKNSGSSFARNAGLERATSPWVAFLDSDDYWTPSHLSRMVKAIQETEGRACLYFSDMQMGEREGSTTLWKTIGFAPPHPIHLVLDGTNWAFLARQPTMLQCSVFRKEEWLHSGGLDPRFRLMHDTDLFFRLSVGNPVCAVAGIGCVQTDDDVSEVRLTTAVHSSQPAHWDEWLALWRSVRYRFRNLAPCYQVVINHGIASVHWRLFRLYWQRRNPARCARHLLSAGFANPAFALSLLRYGRSDANMPRVLPEY